MATKAYPTGFTGAVALPSTAVIDSTSFMVREEMSHEDVSFYDTDTTHVYNPHRGAATYHQQIDVKGFAAYNNAFTPGFGAHTATGGSATFTIASGVTIAGA